jgi:hypothetical protein
VYRHTLEEHIQERQRILVVVRYDKPNPGRGGKHFGALDVQPALHQGESCIEHLVWYARDGLRYISVSMHLVEGTNTLTL